MRIEQFVDGYAINADCTAEETLKCVSSLTNNEHANLIVTDPPYGNVVSESWDTFKGADDQYAAWMFSWTRAWMDKLNPGGAFYVWGGIGTVGFRPFMKYVYNVETPGTFELANLITWKKRRGYGVQNNYLFTREECAYFVKGNAKKPAVFNVPFLEEKRGYAGFNKDYPAKSEHYRRTNVWNDITELMQGKDHPTQKPVALHQVIVETHTNKGDWVFDPFAGTGCTAVACRNAGRRFIVVEFNDEYFEKLVSKLRV